MKKKKAKIMPTAITEITETICICYEVLVSRIEISLMDFTKQNPLRWLPCIPATLNCHSPIIGVEVLFHVITLKRAGIVNDFLKNWTASTENNLVDFELSLTEFDQGHIRIPPFFIEVFEHQLKMISESVPVKSVLLRHCISEYN